MSRARNAALLWGRLVVADRWIWRLLAAWFSVLLLTLSSVGRAADWAVWQAATDAAGPMMEPLLMTVETVGQRAPLAVLVAVAAGWVAWRHGKPLALWWAVGAPVLFTVVVGGTKVMLGRTFPHEQMHGWMEGGLAFPSGHAAGAVTFWGVLLLLLWPTRPFQFSGWWLFAPWVLVATCSLLRGTHWASDLIAGAVMGLLVLRLLVLADRALERSVAAVAPSAVAV